MEKKASSTGRMSRKQESVYMGIPGSDFDKIEYIKANSIDRAGKILSKSLGLSRREMNDCDYRVFQVPDKEMFNIFRVDRISWDELRGIGGAYKHFYDSED